MWLRSEVDEACEYRVSLCQHATGRRSFQLLAVGGEETDDSVFVTGIVPTALLLRRDFIGISKAVTLSNGQPFGVDAHGIWFTGDELDALNARADWDSVPWLNSLPPILPPK